MENELAIIEQQIPGLEMTNDEVLSRYDRLRFFMKELKRMQDLYEQGMLEWIQAHGDLIVSDSVRYYAGTEKTTKCVDVKAAVEALLDATGGDLNAMSEILSFQPIKHGSARKVLAPEVFDKLFKVEVRTTLEEGKPAKKLVKADDKFIR